MIDVFFCQVRPSPWRQSVDLANMMLTLALVSDPQTVYRLALERFEPDEIAEAFAASRGVTIPTQLRKMLADDGRDLPGVFRSLAPPRAPRYRRVGESDHLFEGRPLWPGSSSGSVRPTR